MSATAAGESVGIVLVNWNGWRDTVECIDSILTQDHGNFHIFVVDNDSRDASVERISAWCARPLADDAWSSHAGVRRWSSTTPAAPIACRVIDQPAPASITSLGAYRITVIRTRVNGGFAAGCNAAVRASAPDLFDFFWFLNNDTVIHADALSRLLARARCEPRPGITGSTIRYYGTPHVVQAQGGARMNVKLSTSRHVGADTPVVDIPATGTGVESQMSYVMGASMLVSRQFIDTIGLMQEDYFLFYEEIDWALRARGKFNLGYAPASHVLHKAQASAKKAVGFSTRFYYRNRIRFAGRFYPEHLGSTKRGLLVELLRHAANGRWLHVKLILAALREAGPLAAEAAAHGDHRPVPKSVA